MIIIPLALVCCALAFTIGYQASGEDQLTVVWL